MVELVHGQRGGSGGRLQQTGWCDYDAALSAFIWRPLPLPRHNVCARPCGRRYIRHYFTSRCHEWPFFKDKPVALMEELGHLLTVTYKTADDTVFVDKARALTYMPPVVTHPHPHSVF